MSINKILISALGPLKKIFVLMALTAASLSCDNNPTPDKLNELGLLGTWEIQTQSINGIMDMSVKCCDFIEFNMDQNPDDFTGSYRSYGLGVEAMGVFTIDPAAGILIKDPMDDQEIFEYDLYGDVLEISYSENNNLIVQSYIKIE